MKRVLGRIMSAVRLAWLTTEAEPRNDKEVTGSAASPEKAAGSSSPMTAIYSHLMFDAWSSQSHSLCTHELQLVVAYCPNRELRILNIGCGSGRETFALDDLGYRHLAGVDYTDALLRSAVQRNDRLNVGIQFRLADACCLPFPAGAFDLVTMFENVHGHITPRSARVAALRETKRVLRPGGLSFVEATSMRDSCRGMLLLHALSALYRLHNLWRMELGDKLMRNARRLHVPAHDLPRSHWFRPGEIDGEANEAGLRVLVGSTTRAIVVAPRKSSTRYYHQGRFI